MLTVHVQIINLSSLNILGGVQNLIKLTKRPNSFMLKNKNETNQFRSYQVTVKLGQLELDSVMLEKNMMGRGMLNCNQIKTQ